MNKLKFALSVLKHQKQIGFAAYNFDRIDRESGEFNEEINKLHILGQDLALARSNFKCENPECVETDNLQVHHLIMRKAKEFIPANIYLSQRHYGGNIVVLCKKCHDKYHTIMKGKQDDEELS